MVEAKQWQPALVTQCSPWSREFTAALLAYYNKKGNE